MQTPAISVIIPVYNTEQYLRESIGSILRQTYKEIEILVVNDGSTDKSPEILKFLAEKDSRVKIITQENQGLSAARNAGLRQARGKYVYFMDSDDLLEENALGECMEQCEKNNLDFVFFNADPFPDDPEISLSLSITYQHSNIGNKIYRGPEILEYLISTNQYIVSACLMLIRTEFLKKKNLFFYPGIIHEDQLFTTLLYLQAQKTGYIGKSYFKRRVRSDSIMTKKFSFKNLRSYLTVTEEILSWGKTRDHRIRTVIGRYLSQMLNAVTYNSYVLPFNKKIYLVRECFKLRVLHLIPVSTIIKMFLKS